MSLILQMRVVRSLVVKGEIIYLICRGHKPNRFGLIFRFNGHQSFARKVKILMKLTTIESSSRSMFSEPRCSDRYCYQSVNAGNIIFKFDYKSIKANIEVKVANRKSRFFETTYFTVNWYTQCTSYVNFAGKFQFKLTPLQTKHCVTFHWTLHFGVGIRLLNFKTTSDF